MRVSVLLTTFFVFIVLQLAALSANAGFFDSVIDSAKKAAEKIVDVPIGKSADDKAAETSQVDQQPASSSKTAAAYDPTLVKQIQQGLNRLGFNTGTPDGIYGPGTRKAIEAFQKDQQLAVDGQPSEALLATINSTQTAATGSTKKATAAGSPPPEPTTGAYMLAAVHYRPELIDNESTLKQVLLTVHPDLQAAVGNEFKWHKRKSELKNQLLQEAKNAQLVFELQPWRDSSFTKERPLELLKYDFDRQAFLVRVLTKMLAGGEVAAKYPQSISWFSIPPDQAEKIDSYFKGNRRQVYLHYRLKAMGALIEQPSPTPVMEFVDDQVELYAREATPQGNKMHTEYKLLATVKLPLTDNPTPMQVDTEAIEPHTAKATDVIQNAVVDGVKLGMPIEKALTELKAHGFEMEQPSQPSPLTGVTIKGRGVTADGAGWIDIMIRHMDGVVYQYYKSVNYRKFPAGATASKLHTKYQTRFVDRFADARYHYEAGNKKIHFDDQKPPPYGGKIATPHVQIYLSDAKQAGSFVANLDLTWKQPVGADW